ncbi:MAG: DUF6268 family outer membrane beta-barrel protein [Gemmatimonadales bacterium]
MTRTPSLVAGLVVLAASSLAAQQRPPIVSVSFDMLPYSSLADPLPGTAEEDLKVSIANPRIQVNLPIRIGRNGALVNSFSYSQLNFNYREATAPGNAPDQLHALSYRLALNVPMSERWRFLAFAEPGLASDLENVESDHLRFQGGVVFTRRLASGGSVGVGAAVQNNFGQALPLPVLNVDARSGALRFDLRLPRSAGAFLRAGSGTEIGLAANVEGSHYRLGGAPVEGRRVRYSVLTVGPTVSTRLGSVTTARLSSGAAVGRRFEIQDADQNELRSIGLEPAFFVRLSFDFGSRGAAGNGKDAAR